VYLSISSELPTVPLIAALHSHGHRVYVPLTLPDWKMRFVPLRGATPLRRRGAFRLLEPCSTRPRLSARALDLIVLPLLAFDASGTRLGNGGGYYDRALAGPRVGRRPRLVGHAYAAQEMAGLPRERWDVTLDAVVTERGLRRFR
jgi:5-formyltetrahydrofolate cyclo-ligase